MLPRATTPVRTGTGISVPTIIIGSQNIEDTRRPIINQEVGSAEPLDASINKVPSKHRDPTPIWSKAIDRKFTNKSSADVYARCRMNLTSDTVLSKSPSLMDFGMSSVNTMDELGSVFPVNTIIGLATIESNWIPHRHGISEATTDIVCRMKANNHYNFKSEFENRRDKVVDQDFGRKNDPMSHPSLDSTHMRRPPLDLTSIGTNTTNGKTSPRDSILTGTKLIEHTPLTLPMDL